MFMPCRGQAHRHCGVAALPSRDRLRQRWAPEPLPAFRRLAGTTRSNSDRTRTHGAPLPVLVTRHRLIATLQSSDVARQGEAR
jgi:hypothetical protein